jgi:hypothetical protein
MDNCFDCDKLDYDEAMLPYCTEDTSVIVQYEEIPEECPLHFRNAYPVKFHNTYPLKYC